MKLNLTLPVIGLMLVTSCRDDENNFDSAHDHEDEIVYRTDLPTTFKSNSRSAGQTNVAIYMAEYVTSGESEEMGRTLFFSNRGNKQLGADFVAALSLDGSPDISYYIDQNRATSDVPAAQSTMTIQNAMGTWDGLRCSDLGMSEVPFDGRPTGFVSAIFGFGGSLDYVSDVTHCGWLGGNFFDLLAPGGSNFILGVTFTIIFIDANGDPVDTDRNRKADVAWREIYYNDNFLWQNGARFDIETVALHEAGHGLSQGHFGAAFRTVNGLLHFSPRAVMNAAYSGVQTSIEKSDKAGHCSNWSMWPLN